MIPLPPPNPIIYAFHYDGTAVLGWEDGIEVPAGSTGFFYNKYYLSLADIDGDEDIEVIVACGDGLIIALNNDGTRVSGWSEKQAGHYLTAAPSIADIDGNGTVDLAIGSLDWFCYAWDLGVPYNEALMDWPLWRQNPANTGWFNPGNRAPRIRPMEDITVNVNEPIQFQVEAGDINFDYLTFSAQGLPDGAVFDPVTGMFSWTPQLHPGRHLSTNLHSL